MPFPTNLALEAAVVADCENDLPRLVYADWLEENGDPGRAAFIRTQIALHDKHPADPDFVDLELIQADLAEQLGGRHDLYPPAIDGVHFPRHQPLSELAEQGWFARGFPAMAFAQITELAAGQLTGPPVTTAVGRMAAETTLRGLCLPSDWTAILPPLLDAAAAHRLTTLVTVGGRDGHVDLLAPLARSGVVSHLRRLSVTTVLPRHAFRTLAGAPFRQLTHLDLPSAEGSPAEMRLMLKADWVRRLREVRLSVGPGEPAEPLLKGLAGLPHLHTLRLTGGRNLPLAALRKAGVFPALGRLEVWDANLRGDQADALTGCHFPRLAVLVLTGNVPGSAARKLAAADWFAGLRTLAITSDQLTARGVEDLAAAANLRSLAVHDAALTGEPLRAIASCFPDLRSLELRNYLGHTVTDREVAGLLGGLASPHLKSLSLHGFVVGPLAAEAAAGNPALSNLTLLRLENAAMTPEGVETLVTSPHLQRLIRLDFLGYTISTRTTGGDGLAPLFDPAVMPDLIACGTPNGLADDLRAKLEAARPEVRFA